MASRFDSNSPSSVTSCDDSVSSSLLRSAHAHSSGLSFLMSPSQQLNRLPLHTTIVLKVFHTGPDRPCNNARPIQYKVATLLADDLVFVSLCNVSHLKRHIDTRLTSPWLRNLTIRLAASLNLAPLSYSCSSAAQAGSPAQAVTPLHVAPTDYIHHITPCQHVQMIPKNSCIYRLGLTFGGVVVPSFSFLYANLTRFHKSLNQHMSSHDTFDRHVVCA